MGLGLWHNKGSQGTGALHAMTKAASTIDHATPEEALTYRIIVWVTDEDGETPDDLGIGPAFFDTFAEAEDWLFDQGLYSVSTIQVSYRDGDGTDWVSA